MKASRKAKSAFLTSLISLVLCFSMLLGTTYAWFTDTASTGVNQIMAGTLNVEVDYQKADGSWATIENAKTLFSNNLWEPGHTEFVYLRVKNAGSLALKYKVMVTPVSENGGINVAGNNFKLSDHLVFGTTTPAAACPNYTRDTARAAAGDTKGLNQAALTKTGTITAGAADQYLALVVYMPEDVGNEANAKPGTVAPSINLGIKVVATQLENEFDSFDKNYDSGAVNAPEYVVGPAYNYFPQVMASAPVAASGDTTITAKGKLNASDETLTDLAVVTVPSGASLEEGTNELTVKVVPTAATNPAAQNKIAAEIADGRETANFDIKVDGIKSNNTVGIAVKAFVGTGLNNVKVFHNGVQVSDATYDPATGYVQFTTKTFSDFTVSYDPAVAAIGTKTYGSMANAVAAAKDGDTVVLLKDIELTKTIDVNKTLIVNLNGATIKGKDVRVFNVQSGTLTLTSTGTVTSVKTSALDPSSSVIRVGNNGTVQTKVDAGLVIDKNVTITAPATYGVTVFGSATNETVVVKGKINATPAAAISGNGSKGYGGTAITIEPTAELTSVEDAAIYHPQAGTLTINGGSISGTTAIEAKSGTVNIMGGTLTATGSVSHSTNSNGTSTTGYALAVVRNNAYSGNTVATVTGGSLNGAIAVLKDNDTSKTGTISITGGTFSSDPNAYCTNGHGAVKENGVYKVVAGNFAKDTAGLTEAIKAANEGDVITITKPLETITIPSFSKRLTIKGDGETKAVFANDVYGNSAANLPAGAVFEGFIVECGDSLYHGFHHSGQITFKNCTLNGFLTTYGDMKFENCRFNGGNDKYSINFYGGENFELTNCHFYGVNKNVYIYQETLDHDKNVTFNSCDFHMSAASDTKSAVMLNSPYNYNGHEYHVVLNNCTTEGNMNTTAAADEATNTNYQGLYGLKHNPLVILGTVTVNDTVVYNQHAAQ